MTANKILVIDDSGVIRKTVREMLPKGNFEVLEAKDGVEGLNLIHQEKPSLIMLDFILPKLSGWEIFQQVQVQPELQKIPLVIMSGRKEEVTSKISEPFEFFEFIEKPFDKKGLTEAIKEAMRKVRLRPASIVTASIPPGMGGVNRSNEAGALEIQALKHKIAKMQGEIDIMKKQLAQVISYIKQKV
ncbi:response regulator [Merismopedia glauca]|uniref:Two-component system response regulator n=1 Tax=Merismopedia glauca CCAP 1448/3 TaxID=1296344 RepID=A0A2T1BWT6_9CYAN|nr:response regulator [Merismopedia glauca]PSB00384.1 two-component system response regulator [Merismopedia glauca CCAP 1448/3]